MPEDPVISNTEPKVLSFYRFLAVYGALWVACLGLTLALPGLSPRFVIVAALVTFVGGVSFLFEVRGAASELQKMQLLFKLVFVLAFSLLFVLLFNLLARRYWSDEFATLYRPAAIAFGCFSGAGLVGWYGSRESTRKE